MLVGIDVVNVMAAYQPVVQACGSQWRQELSVFGAIDTRYEHKILLHDCHNAAVKATSMLCAEFS